MPFRIYSRADMHRTGRTFIVALLLSVICGCGRVQRTISIDSQPQGALVYANNQELGRTPIKRDFVWYGTYDVAARLDGYEAKKEPVKVVAPWWQWPPIDLLVELLPIHAKDERHYTITLEPASTQPADPELMLSRAEQMRLKLEGSRYTRNPATMPVTQPATTRATTRATTTSTSRP
jgi:hypothetical protein